MNRQEIKERTLWAIQQVVAQEIPAWDDELGHCVYEDPETGSCCIAGWYFKDIEVWQAYSLFPYEKIGEEGLEDLELNLIWEMQDCHDEIVNPRIETKETLEEGLMRVFYKYFPEEKDAG